MSLPTKQPKPKTCKNPACAGKFIPQRLGQAVCGPRCAIVEAKQPANQKKARVAIEQRERREVKARKEALKTHGDYVGEATSAVQAYRRVYELSIGSGCMSCGKTQAQVQADQGWKTGGAWDGGHFLGKGARPELRLVEQNIWLQCKGCNGGSAKYARKGESVANGFRAGLIERIGLEAVEALEADHMPRKPATEELKTITAEYRAKLRELKKVTA
ncbi:recombination protein NinG [Pseudomonas paeninsulae]|uniref:recombination protein NinG n=1 Tax=Pseudomonas paeninsulae TaxID=3110772 RepID=UPI002D7A3E61|nr:recombination protein NinG [Pseudomonas sp. IT1137]